MVRGRLSAVQLARVGFRYRAGGPWVLDDVTAEVNPGDTIVLDGRNGAGKSTLLQLIVGVLRPTRGQIRNRPARIGWVPERFPADQAFTVGQYLRGVAGMRGLSGPDAHAPVERWIERLGISAYADSRLPDLSKGTAQKVGLAQALLVPPDLLVLDEPWEGLDVASRELVPTLIAEVLADGGAAIVSDHRGEAGRLPGAELWRLTDDGFTTEAPPERAMCLVEVAVSAADAPAAVALLRAAGHDRVRVRPAE
jgi:ABC-2 type transport system ATP-binding protein